MTKTSAAAIIIGLIVIGGIAYALMSADSSMMKDDSASMIENTDAVQGAAMTGDAVMKNAEMMKDEIDTNDGMMRKGTYETYAAEKLSLANSGDVVLFFRATWCPVCKALDADIRSRMDSIPAGLTILDVNYDDSTALKKKYGVTYQHTFVQVTADGTLIKKWSGSPTLAALVSEVQ